MLVTVVASRSSAPTVSILVPLYNCLALTQACLASLDATWPAEVSRELILVDDGSTDGTRDWLASLHRSDTRVVLNERNLGYAASNNRAAAVAEGRLLALLNNDLVLQPGWLPPMLAAHRALGHRAGVVGNVQTAVDGGQVDHAGIRINPKGKPEHIRALPFGSAFGLRRFCAAEAVTGACLLVDRALWRELGGFDEGYVNGCEDVDLCFRAAEAGRRNVVALRSRVRHHVSSSPGRKRRDEANTNRLTLRWRDHLVHLAVRRWCADFLWREWTHPHDPRSAADAAAALLYRLHLRPHPPGFALAGLQEAIGRELSRWSALGF